MPIPLDNKYKKLKSHDFELELSACRHLKDVCFLQVASNTSKKPFTQGHDPWYAVCTKACFFYLIGEVLRFLVALYV